MEKAIMQIGDKTQSMSNDEIKDIVLGSIGTCKFTSTVRKYIGIHYRVSTWYFTSDLDGIRLIVRQPTTNEGKPTIKLVKGNALKDNRNFVTYSQDNALFAYGMTS